MRHRKQPIQPSYQELKARCEQYRRLEDPTYKVATLFIDKFWGRSQDVADAIVVFLLVWNKAFHNRFGKPDSKRLASALEQEAAIIKALRRRTILNYNHEIDSETASKLFTLLLHKLRTKNKNPKNRRVSPVGTAKTLHLLAPSYFPLWDNAIARKYGCIWGKTRPPSERYTQFMRKIKEVCWHVVKDFSKRKTIQAGGAVPQIVEQCSPARCRHSLVKIVDEYNFMKFVRPLLRNK